MGGQSLLGYLIIPLNIYNKSEASYWFSPLNLHKHLQWKLRGPYMTLGPPPEQEPIPLGSKCQWAYECKSLPNVRRTSLVAQTVKHLSTMWETWVRSLGWEDPLEKEMAIHSRIIAWKIPWTERPGRLQSMGSQRVGHDWVTSLSLSLSSVRRASCFCSLTMITWIPG